MNFFTVGFYYISWHYTRGISDLVGVFINLIWFLWHYFSISILFKTLLEPFKRLKEKNNRFDIGKWFESIIISLLMRIVGAVLRIFVISFGFLCILGMFFLGVISIIVWILLPLILTFLIIASFFALIKQS